MRKLLIAAAAGMMTLSALPVAAAVSTAEPQARPYNSAPDNEPGRPGPHNGQHNGGPSNGPGTNGPGRGPGDDEYGRWDDSWGARPAGPPRHFSRHNDWYRHVRACSQRYRTYNPRTDTFVIRRGRTAICRL